MARFRALKNGAVVAVMSPSPPLAKTLYCPCAIRVLNWIIRALIVSWFRSRTSRARTCCSAAAWTRSRSARSWTILSSARMVLRMWVWSSRSRDVLTPSETWSADRTTDCARRSALSAASGCPWATRSRARWMRWRTSLVSSCRSTFSSSAAFSRVAWASRGVAGAGSGGAGSPGVGAGGTASSAAGGASGVAGGASGRRGRLGRRSRGRPRAARPRAARSRAARPPVRRSRSPAPHRPGHGRGVLERDADDAGLAAQGTTRLGVVRVELQGLAEERPRLGGLALGEGLSAEFGKLPRQRRGLGRSGHDAGKQQAAQRQ